MDPTLKISVIMSVYNADEYLKFGEEEFIVEVRLEDGDAFHNEYLYEHIKSVLRKFENDPKKHFKKAISIESNAEPLLGLASCLRIQDTKLAIQLAKKALNKNPNYVNYLYREEQLWGEKLQASTEILLQNDELQTDVILAKSKINASS